MVRPGGEQLDVPVGEHLVDLGDRRVQIVVGAAVDNTLVVPSAYSDAIDLSEPGRADLTALFSAALGEGSVVLVAPADELWSGTAGRVDWKQLVAAEEKVTPLVVPPVTESRRKALAPPVLMGIGSAVALGGGVWSAVQYGVTKEHAALTEEATSDVAWARDHAGWETERNKLIVAYGVAGVGLVLGASGLALQLGDATVVARPDQITIHVRR
jgi:hypothetical protein